MTMTVLTVDRFLSLLCTTISSQKAIEFYLLAANCRILEDERKRKCHLQDHKRKESKRERKGRKRDRNRDSSFFIVLRHMSDVI